MLPAVVPGVIYVRVRVFRLSPRFPRVQRLKINSSEGIVDVTFQRPSAILVPVYHLGNELRSESQYEGIHQDRDLGHCLLYTVPGTNIFNANDLGPPVVGDEVDGVHADF